MFAISIFDLSIPKRIDSVIPSNVSEKSIRIYEGPEKSAITFQHTTGVKRLDLLNVSVLGECPHEMRCINNTLRLLYLDSLEYPTDLFDVSNYTSSIFEVIEYAGQVEIYNGESNLFSGKLTFCKIWCQKDAPLNVEGQVNLPCLPRSQKGSLEVTTSLKGS